MNKQRTILFEKILGCIGDLYRSFATSRDQFLAKLNLTRPQLELLLVIKKGEVTTTELAKTFSITSSAVSQMVDQLEERKLVERVKSMNDRRVSYVRLAPEGAKIFATMKAEYLDHLDTKFKDVTNKELEALLKIMTRTIETIGRENGKDC